MGRRRRRWRSWQRDMDAERFLFLNETATATTMTRRYGRGPAGRRLVAAVPHGHGKTTPFIAGLRRTGIIAALVLDGPMTGRAFCAYVEQVLLPALDPGEVVVLDNLAAHQVKGIQAAIATAGAPLLDLPPDSPDRNPIEMVFAKFKAMLRKTAARTQHQRWTAIGDLIPAVSAAACPSYLHHCGYDAT